MTREQALEQLKQCVRFSEGDCEWAHGRADEILCEFLNFLGYRDIVAEWEKVEKWYA